MNENLTDISKFIGVLKQSILQSQYNAAKLVNTQLRTSIRSSLATELEIEIEIGSPLANQLASDFWSVSFTNHLPSSAN